MHHNKMVCCLKANGKILRDNKGEVFIPFGTEYSILLKNLNTIRSRVQIFVDGVDITEGIHSIVSPNSTLEFMRYVNNGNLGAGNKFKFIERTSDIEQHRGINMEDGIIRVEFQYEPIIRLGYTPPPILWNRNQHPYDWGDLYRVTCSGTAISAGESAVFNTQSNYYGSAGLNNNVGITVPGSMSNQPVLIAPNLICEPEKHVIILQLRGISDQNKPILRPVTTEKQKCTICGKSNKGSSKFCSNCGTSLLII